MTPLAHALLLALAAYRLAHAVAREDGPADVCVWLRSAAYHRWPASSLDRGLQCPLCISFWLVWPLALLPSLPLVALAAAGLALVIHRLLEAADAHR